MVLSIARTFSGAKMDGAGCLPVSIKRFLPAQPLGAWDHPDIGLADDSRHPNGRFGRPNQCSYGSRQIGYDIPKNVMLVSHKPAGYFVYPLSESRRVCL